MTDVRQRERRTLPVVLLDATLALATGQLPWSKVSTEEPTGDRSPRKRRAAVWITIAAVAAAAGTVLLLVAFLRSPGGLAPLGTASPPPAAGEAPSRAATPTPALTPTAGAGGFGSPAPATPGADGQPGRAPVTTPTPPPGTTVPLTAQYANSSGGPGLLGYRATITIQNPGATVPAGWSVTLTLPRSTLQVANVAGATVKQDGATWTFTPVDATAQVPAGGSVAVTFEVHGATLVDAAPRDCTIDGRPCEGLDT
jgi:hypothetical protein